MEQEVMSSWVKNMKDKAVSTGHTAADESHVTVVRREHKANGKKGQSLVKTQGQVILEISEKIFPAMLKLFSGKRDREGMLLQSSHIRGMALNVAQKLVKNHTDKKSA